MKYVFVSGRLAVVIRYWEQRGAEAEAGARVDLRRVEQVEGRAHRPGAAGFAVQPVSDGGIWRADLFTVLTRPGTPCFHYHPRFEHDDVGERFVEDELTVDPRGWIERQLRDLPALLERSGAGDIVASVDMAEFERALPLMLSAVDACLARIPTAYVSAGA